MDGWAGARDKQTGTPVSAQEIRKVRSERRSQDSSQPGQLTAVEGVATKITKRPRFEWNRWPHFQGTSSVSCIHAFSTLEPTPTCKIASILQLQPGSPESGALHLV